MGSPVNFNGTFAKTIPSQFNLGGAIYQLTGTADPTSVAQNAPAGSLYFRTSTGDIYRKTDGGSSTNWVLLSANGAVGNWTTFTPTGTWSSNTTYTGKYRRVGDSAQIQVSLTTSGAPTAATLAINLPSGLTIDTAKLANSSNFRSSLGTAYVRDDSAGSNLGAFVMYNDSSSVWVALGSGTTGLGASLNPITNTSPFTFAASDVITVEFWVPISGWTSGQVLPLDQVYLQYTGNAGNSLTANVTDATWSTKVKDSHNAWNGTTFTATRDSWYNVSGTFRISSSNTLNLYCYKNGTQNVMMSFGATSVRYLLSGGIYLLAGETLSFRSDVSVTLLNTSFEHTINISSQG